MPVEGGEAPVEPFQMDQALTGVLSGSPEAVEKYFSVGNEIERCHKHMTASKKNLHEQDPKFQEHYLEMRRQQMETQNEISKSMERLVKSGLDPGIKQMWLNALSNTSEEAIGMNRAFCGFAAANERRHAEAQKENDRIARENERLAQELKQARDENAAYASTMAQERPSQKRAPSYQQEEPSRFTPKSRPAERQPEPDTRNIVPMRKEYMDNFMSFQNAKVPYNAHLYAQQAEIEKQNQQYIDSVSFGAFTQAQKNQAVTRK